MVVGDNFWNTPWLACYFGSIPAATTLFINQTLIYCSISNLTDTTVNYPIGITLNGNEFAYSNQSIILTSSIIVFEIRPVVVFMQQFNVEIEVYAQPIYSSNLLSCKIHHYVSQGTMIYISGVPWVKCIIPSYQAINMSDPLNPIPANNTVFVEISNNGIDFSNSQKYIKFIDANQFKNFFPTNGPDVGGTIITIGLGIDQTLGNIGAVYCRFPGNSD